MIKRYTDPREREKTALATKVGCSTEEARARRSAATRKRWKDPVYRAKKAEAQRIYWAKSESHAKASEILHRRYEDPVAREVTGMAMAKAFSTPRMRRQCSRVAKKSHARSEVRARISEGTVAGLANKRREVFVG